jgi:hypothetical protein
MCLRPSDDRGGDAYTIELFRKEDGTPGGRVVLPGGRRGGAPRRAPSRGCVSPRAAIEMALWLAGRAPAAIVVWDPEGLWPADWGHLSRA